MIDKKLGDFEILGKIGAGGMGEVYRGHDGKLQREVAIKVLPGAFADDPERLARFQREARTLASLNHTNIAAIYDLDEQDGSPFLVMEYVEGEDLSDRLARGPMALEESLEIARQIADGLEEAHERGVVHRDLKPANIKIAVDGKVKILDFGLARAFLGETVDEAEVENSPTITAAMTQKGMILGTAAYMSPEQARGKAVDRRADLWSFGVILWEMLTGKQLFKGETISDTLAAVLRKEPVWDDLPGDTPPAVRRLLERCLDRDPRKRLRDIGEARIRLERWRDDPGSMHLSSIGIPAAAAEELGPWKKQWLPWAFAGFALIVAAWSWLAPTGMESNGAETTWMEIRVPQEDLLTDDVKGGFVVSPGGERIATLSESGISIRQDDRLEPVFIPVTDGVRLAEFSPDGNWIAFWSKGLLKRVSVTGGAAIEICAANVCRGIDWVDMETLVVSLGINSGLSIVSLKTGDLRELTSPDLERGERSHRWPFAIPGGKYVLMMNQYFGKHYEESDIELVSLEDGSRETVYSGGAYPHYASSGYLLFARDNTVFAAPFEPGRGGVSGLAVAVLQDVLTSVMNQEADDGSAAFDLTPTGVLVYRTGTARTTGLSRLAWLDLDTGIQVPFGDPAHRRSPRLSPDGKSLAFSKGEADKMSIYVLDLATLVERRLSFDDSDIIPIWSPDSQFLYWERTNKTGRSLVRQRADGSSPAEILRKHPQSMRFLPRSVLSDGRHMLGTLWTVESAYEVALAPLDSPEEEIHLLSDGKAWRFAHELSPDESWIVYSKAEGGGRSLHLMPFPDTGARWQLTDPDGTVYGSHWVENGTAIIFRDTRGILRIDLETQGQGIVSSSPRMLHEEDNFRAAGGRDFAVTPDGKRAIVLEPERGDNVDTHRSVVMVRNWLPHLEAQVAAAQ